MTLTVGTGAGSPQGTSAGDLVYVSAGANTAGQTILSITDSKSNSYSAVNGAGTSSNLQFFWASLTTHALVSGTDTMTFTFSTATGSKQIIARGCPGISSAAPDKINSATGSSISPNSGASGNLSQSSELIVGIISNPAGGGTPANFSFGTGMTVTQGNLLTEFDEVVTSSGSLSAKATISSAIWSASITTFKMTSVASPAAIIPLLAGCS